MTRGCRPGIRFGAAAVLVLTLGACSSVPVTPTAERETPAVLAPARKAPSATVPRGDARPTVTPSLALETRRALVGGARQWLGLGLRQFEVEGIRYPADCSGYVQAVYAGSGLPFRERLIALPASEGGAAAAIYRLMLDSGEFYADPGQVLPGDLIFWDNTYDRNRNGRLDDPLTHVAIAERVDTDGTVHYLHRGSRGVTVGYLNLSRPDSQRDAGGKTLNSGIRQRRPGDPPGTRYLSSHLFVAFGRFDPRLWMAGQSSGN